MSARILVVDDDAATRKVLSRLLASEGYAVEVCESATQALAQLAQAPFDVLLTDLVMPDMGGRELVAQAKQLQPELRCVVMSGHRKSASDARDLAWIDKPIDVDQLLALLAT